MRYSARGAISFALRFSFFSAFLLGFTLFLGRSFFPPESIPAGADEASRFTVIIDAGHGGRDGGAVADDGTQEKVLNLSVAKKLADMLLLSDVHVVMTRSEDVELALPTSDHKKRDDLNARLAMTEAYENAILVSIHMNKFPQAQYSGLQVYYSTGAPESRTVAGVIRNYTKQYLQPQNEREIKAATSSIYLLHRCDIPAVMVECGFLSNEEELSHLKDETYRRQLALVIACAAAESLSGVKQ